MPDLPLTLEKILVERRTYAMYVNDPQPASTDDTNRVAVNRISKDCLKIRMLNSILVTEYLLEELR